MKYPQVNTDLKTGFETNCLNSVHSIHSNIMKNDGSHHTFDFSIIKQSGTVVYLGQYLLHFRNVLRQTKKKKKEEKDNKKDRNGKFASADHMLSTHLYLDTRMCM